MSAKICKRLRRTAERISVDRPNRELVKQPVAHGYYRKNFAVVNHPVSTRGIYRAMKREVKRTKGITND